jgi:CheY-like chemotaxis protein
VAKITVLIADDLKFFLEIEKSYLQRAGFEVLAAGGGEQAVDLARERKPNLILLDLEMPHMDGVAACEAIRREPALALTPVIIMSARGDDATRERCLKAGCTEFVVKPENPEELLGLVARILAVKQREAARLTVVFNVTGHHGARQVVGRATNLGPGGLLLESTAPLSVGSMLQLEFFLPKTRHQVKVEGEVTRTETTRDGVVEAGVRFTDLSQSDQEQILEYVSS